MGRLAAMSAVAMCLGAFATSPSAAEQSPEPILTPLPEPIFPPPLPFADPTGDLETGTPSDAVGRTATKGETFATEPATTQRLKAEMPPVLVADGEMAEPRRLSTGEQLLLGVASFVGGTSDATVVGAHLVSWHTNDGLNNVNPGMYVRFPIGITGGFVRNSYDRTSAYLGWTWEKNWVLSQALAARCGFSLTTGVVSGYEGPPMRPLLAPSLALGLGKSALRLAYLDGDKTSALHLMFEMKR